jgi:transposase
MQYQKERLRRKLCWLLSGKYKESEIAEMLGISRRTVIRDMNKIKPYYFRLSRAYFSKLEQERIKELNLKLEGKSLFDRINILSKELKERQRRLFQERQYRSHYTILMLDMTQPGPYGLPKLSFEGTGRTLAYPHKIRVMVKAKYEDKTFVADIGGFNIIQTTANRGWF